MLYLWKGGDTRISEIKFAGTTGPTGTSGTRYIRYPRYRKTPNAWFYDKPDVNEITDLTESGKLNQVPGIYIFQMISYIVVQATSSMPLKYPVQLACAERALRIGKLYNLCARSSILHIGAWSCHSTNPRGS